eukprot:2875749-Rhodomonas_salina.1
MAHGRTHRGRDEEHRTAPAHAHHMMLAAHTTRQGTPCWCSIFSAVSSGSECVDLENHFSRHEVQQQYSRTRL